MSNRDDSAKRLFRGWFNFNSYLRFDIVYFATILFTSLVDVCQRYSVHDWADGLAMLRTLAIHYHLWTDWQTFKSCRHTFFFLLFCHYRYCFLCYNVLLCRQLYRYLCPKTFAFNGVLFFYVSDDAKINGSPFIGKYFFNKMNGSLICERNPIK